jgi:sulfopyruvate decarboxylase TPP-binding subunit
MCRSILGGKRTAMLMQNSGLGNSLTPLLRLTNYTEYLAHVNES